MKRVLKIIGVGFGMTLALGGAWVAYEWPSLSAFPALPSGYEAKELCSCMFVEGRSQADCEAFIRQSVVPIDGRSFDVEGKAVSVKALWRERRAHVVDARHGCVLDPGE